MSYDGSQQALDALIARHKEDEVFNEATTRLQIIDALLMDCLGWHPEDIKAEEHQAGDYLDYVLGQPERKAVVEAKRTGLHFELPAGMELERETTLSAISGYSKTNAQAIGQVLRYGLNGGIPVAILCNGHQIIAFLASRQDGIAPLSGRALLFHGLSDMSRDFPLFWDLLSKEGMQSGRLQARFARRARTIPPPERLSSRLTNYPGFRSRTELETDTRILAELFLQDLVQERAVTDEFLQECYCTSGALSQYALVSKEILRSRYSPIQESSKEPVRDKKGQPSRLTADLLSTAMLRRPLILLGDVGVGKTMFLRHFIRIEAQDVLQRTTVFYVDFLDESALLVDVGTRLAAQITADLLTSGVDIQEAKFIRAVYNRELNQFKRGLYGGLAESEPAEFAREERAMLARHLQDDLEHIRRSLEHLRGTRDISFVIVLDNIDHHEAQFQERVFVIGQSLAATWPAAVFVSLRPDTFYRSRQTGSITAYQPRVFYVEPPRTDLVIRKRLAFARKQLQETGRLDVFPEGLTIDSESLLAYLDVIIEAFDSNERLKELVDNLSSGNVRQALDFLSTFVGSGYVSVERILEVHRHGDRYVLPLHEFMRALLYGEYAHYDPRASAITNLFDLVTGDGKEHFLLLEILAVIQSRGASMPDGFVDTGLVHSHLAALGFTSDQVVAHLNRAEERKLVQSNVAGHESSHVRVTAAGGYMHKRMVAVFSYVDAVVVDTPIVDPSVRSQIVDAKQIDDRLARVELFAEYLDAQWRPLVDRTTAFDWPGAREELRRDVTSTRERARRRRGR